MASYCPRVVRYSAVFILGWLLGLASGWSRGHEAGETENREAAVKYADTQLVQRTGADIGQWERAKKEADALLIKHREAKQK